MKLAVMKSILALMCLCFIGVSIVYGASKKAMDFLTIISGDYDDKVQTEQVGDDHDFIRFRIIPVDIKCFQPNLVYFVEEAVNNSIRLIAVGVVSDGIEDTVSVRYYNFTDYAKYKPREFNVENLSKLSCDDIQGDPDCIASFKVARGFVYGNVPHCVSTVDGKHPRFTVMMTCYTFTGTMPMYSRQTSPIQPYEFPRSGNKYPLINPPDDYVSPCKDDNIKDTTTNDQSQMTS